MEVSICSFAGAMFAVQAGMAIASAATKSSGDMGAYSKKIAAANANADAINRSTIFKYATTGLQQIQVENQAAVREGQERSKLSAAEGEAAAAAGSGGVTGNSVRQLYRGYAVATGSDIMNTEADEKNQLDQGQMQKRGDQMSAQNQILAIKEGLPDAPTASTIGNYVGAALGIGKDFFADTKSIDDKSLQTGGLFGGGGFLGLGRSFG